MLLAKERQTVPTKTALQAKFVAEQPSMKAFSELVQTARARTGELGRGVAEGGDEDLHGRAGRADRPGRAGRRRSSRRRMAEHASGDGAGRTAPATATRRRRRR